MSEVYYFGCKDRAGHYLHDSSLRLVRDPRKLRIPSEHDLDGGPMFLPHPEKKGSGALTYLPACDITVLAWWGNPWDSRGAVNTAVLVRGKHDAEAVWTAFTKECPYLAAKLERPNVFARAEEAPQSEDYKALYMELIYQVAQKHPGETRHETAKRHIYEREHQPSNPAKASLDMNGSK